MKIDIKVPYFCQYDNTIAPGGSCNLTSAWMVIEHFHPGKVKNPDVLLRYCEKKGLDRHELSVIDQILEENGVADQSGYNITFEQLKAHLMAGNPAIVHGMFTASGHIIVVCGFDSAKGTWLCNDPAGKWDPTFHYGGPYWKEGDRVNYSSEWFRKGANPDGTGIWCHLCKKKEVKK